MPDLPPGAGIPPPGGPGPMATRTDKSPGQPVRVPTGLPYGEAKALENAQQAVPLPAAGGTSAPAGAVVSLSAAPAGGTPGQMGPNPLALLSHPTQRPLEPVTALPDGLQQPTPGKVSDMLDNVAKVSGIGSLAALAEQARSLGQ